MPRMEYRPEIGETIIVSLSGNTPFLVTVEGYSHHDYLDAEVFDFHRPGDLHLQDGWSSVSTSTFYKDVPTDTKFYYVVAAVQDHEDRWAYVTEKGWFFKVDEAFALRDEFAGGADCSFEYAVEVRRLS
jgi:hypothetical protein